MTKVNSYSKVSLSSGMFSTPQNYSIRDGGSMSSITTSQVLVLLFGKWTTMDWCFPFIRCNDVYWVKMILHALYNIAFLKNFPSQEFWRQFCFCFRWRWIIWHSWPLWSGNCRVQMSLLYLPILRPSRHYGTLLFCSQSRFLWNMSTVLQGIQVE